MKHLICLTGCLLSILFSNAQIVQYGIVKEFNSNGKPVAGVGITVLTASDVQPVASNTNGSFRLVFSEKKAGDIIYNIRIIRENYEIVNIHDFKNGWTLSTHDTLKIIVAQKGIIAQMRSQYYNMMDQYQENEYRHIIQKLKMDLADQIISTEEYRKKMEAAEEELHNAYNKIEEYADLFARINKDNLDSISNTALTLLEQGKIKEAIGVFESHNLLSQLKNKVKLRDQSIEAMNYLIPKLQEEVTYRQLASGEENMYKIDEILENIALTDTSNFQYLCDYMIFLTNQQELNKAIKWNRMALQNAPNYEGRINALQNLGHIYYKQQDTKNSEECLLKAIEEANRIKENQYESYLRIVAPPMNTLANLYLDNGDYDKAESLFLESVQIYYDLCQTDSSFLSSYVIGLNNLGELYRIMYQHNRDSLAFKKAVHYFDEAFAIRTVLAKENPKKNEASLANILNNKGALFLNAGLYDSASVYYQKANGIWERIVKENPALYSESLIINIGNIGLLNSKLNHYQQAKQYYDRGLEICAQRIPNNPELYRYYQATLLINKGAVYRKAEQYDEARNCYLQALSIRKELERDKFNCVFSVFEVYNNLAVLDYHTEQYDSAAYYFSEAKNNLECLMKKSPELYTRYYATCSYSLAYLRFKEKNVKKAIPEYKKVRKLFKHLAKQSPAQYGKTLEEIEEEYKLLKIMRKEQK